MMSCKKIMSLLLASALACSALAGCSGGTSSTASPAETSSTGTDTSSAAPAESTGEESSAASEGADATAASSDAALVYSQGADPRALDPAYGDDGESTKIMRCIYEGLVRFKNESTELEPSLAESWEVSDDGLTYTFKLRSGVKFHDGTEFNADAVKFSIDRELPPQATEDMPYAEFIYGSVKDVEVVDPLTVKINMKSPNSSFLANLAMVAGAPIVSPTAVQANDNNISQVPCGTGPYKFVRWDKDQAVLLTRNDEYWGPKAVCKDLVFKIIKDNSARVVALNNGEVDIIDGIDPTVVDQITAAGNVVEKYTGMLTSYMVFNTDNAPFNDKDTRRAVASAINVEEMVQSLYQGYNEPAHSFMPSTIPGYSEEVKQVAYDPDTAAATLKEKGITDLRIITYTNPRPYDSVGGQTLAEAVQGYLQKVGITTTIDAYDWTTFKEKAKDRTTWDLLFIGWGGDNGDPDNFMNLFASEDTTMNYSQYKNPEYNALIDKGIQMPNGPERYAVYTECEKLLAEDCPILSLSHATYLAAYRPTIKGYFYHVTKCYSLEEVVKEG